MNFLFFRCQSNPPTDYGHPERAFIQKSRTFGLGQTFWADFFRGIWGIFGWIISTHFGMFSIIQPLFQKKLSLYIIHIPNIFLGLGFEFGLQKN